MRGGGLQKKKTNERVDIADDQSGNTAVVAGRSVELRHQHVATHEEKKTSLGRNTQPQHPCKRST
jgi:hypothetical protein